MAARRRTRWLLAVFAASPLCAHADARANPQPRGPEPAIVDLTLDGCPDIDGARLRELVAIEIATIRAGGQPGPTAARLTCDGPHVRINLVGEAPSGAELDLGGTPAPARPRLLALTITELAAASWVDPSKQIVAQPTPPGSPPAAVMVSASAPPLVPPRARAFVATSLRRIGSPATWLGGAGFGIEYSVRSWLAAAIDVRLEAGETSTATAPIGWRVASGTAGVAFAGDRGRLTWSALPGLSAGLVRLSAAPVPQGSVSTSVDAVWAGPSLTTRLRVAITRGAFVHVELGGGFVTHKVVGLLNNDVALLRIDGVWTIAALGAGLAFH
jgi:hypothetical protein